MKKERIANLKTAAQQISVIGVGVLMNCIVQSTTEEEGKSTKILAGIGGLALAIGLKKIVHDNVGVEVDSLVEKLDLEEKIVVVKQEDCEEEA